MIKKPGNRGYDVKDSFFKEYCESEEEKQCPNPNQGFDVKEDILAHVHKRDINSEIDREPSQDSVHEPHEKFQSPTSSAMGATEEPEKVMVELVDDGDKKLADRFLNQDLNSNGQSPKNAFMPGDPRRLEFAVSKALDKNNI